jgi:hypothetical protein
MQGLRPQFTTEIEKHTGKRDVWSAPAFRITSYKELVQHVARLSYINRSQLLFFRGQDRDYQSKAGGSTLYPTIYRIDNLAEAELDFRFRQLDFACRLLVQQLEHAQIVGARDVARKRYIQWSILQHYEVVATPLLDVTHSLRVACSFAQLASTDESCYVYVLGLPYTTNRISINSEEDIVNIRLLSICPPSALRPYFQEGYMAGTPDLTVNYDTKTEVDFRNRLVAKFAIPRARKFWNSGFSRMPRTALYPSGDEVQALCREVKAGLADDPYVGNTGEFLVEWSRLEERLMKVARRLTERNISVREAIRVMVQQGLLSEDVAVQLDQLRKQRNFAAHAPSSVTSSDVARAHRNLRRLAREVAIGAA